MAYVPPIPQNEQNQNAPSGQTTTNPLQSMPPQSGGSSGQGGGATGTPSAPGSASPSQFGSNASNLSSYLSANAPQIQGMGQNIAGSLNNQFGQVQGDVNTAAGNFGNEVNSGYTADNPTLDQTVASNPVAAVPQASQFQAELNDAYTGPTNFESTNPYAQVQGEVSQAASGAGLLNSPAGLSTYLANNVENNPTPGENTLDTALLESNPTAYQDVTEAAAPLVNLPTYLQGITTAADATVPQAQASAAQTVADAQAAAETASGNFNTELGNELTAQQSAENAYNTNLNTLSGDTSTMNTDLQTYLNALQSPTPISDTYTPIPDQPIAAPSAANVATANDYATSAALANLIGSSYTPGLNQANANEAGTYKIPSAPPTALSQADIVGNDALTAMKDLGANGNGQSQATGKTEQQALATLFAYLNGYDPAISTYGTPGDNSFGVNFPTPAHHPS